MLKIKIETYILLDETTMEVSKVKNRIDIFNTNTGEIIPLTYSTKIWGTLKSILASASGEDLPTKLTLSKSAKDKLNILLSNIVSKNGN